MNPRPDINIYLLTRLNKYKLVVVVADFKGGTHFNYDVVYNSDTNRGYFNTIIEAATHAEMLVANHRKKHNY